MCVVWARLFWFDEKKSVISMCVPSFGHDYFDLTKKKSVKSMCAVLAQSFWLDEKKICEINVCNFGAFILIWNATETEIILWNFCEINAGICEINGCNFGAIILIWNATETEIIIWKFCQINGCNFGAIILRLKRDGNGYNSLEILPVKSILVKKFW